MGAVVPASGGSTIVALNVTQPEINRYWDFVASEIPKTGRRAPQSGVLWHYTSGDGLIGIIQSGDLWTTQVSCVNDSTELRYSNSLLLEIVLARRADPNITPAEAILYEHAIRGLSVDVAPTSGWFVGCFSEDGDDLSQWRAYGGGEGGYAIGFDMAALNAGAAQGQLFLGAVCYDQAIHKQIARSVVDATERFYSEGLLARPGAKAEEWADAFLPVWANALGYIAPVIKHPAFAPEREWRLIRRLQDQDVPRLKFRQRQSMLARHLPVALRATGALDRLPIVGVCVGPSRHKEISKVSVADLLRTKGYPEQVFKNVTMSRVPFQAV